MPVGAAAGSDSRSDMMAELVRKASARQQRCCSPPRARPTTSSPSEVAEVAAAVPPPVGPQREALRAMLSSTSEGAKSPPAEAGAAAGPQREALRAILAQPVAKPEEPPDADLRAENAELRKRLEAAEAIARSPSAITLTPSASQEPKETPREAAAASRRSSVNWLNSLLGREDDDDVAPHV